MSDNRWANMPMSPDEAQSLASHLLDLTDRPAVAKMVADIRQVLVGATATDACVAIAQAAGLVWGVSLGARNARDAAPLSIICQAAWDIGAEEGGHA